ncbi:MAG: hypothetical protein IPM29_09435 [Planctomycetes bacterium]|nr:hypothetical protein [Planctomycetota bacterium]
MTAAVPASEQPVTATRRQAIAEVSAIGLGVEPGEVVDAAGFPAERVPVEAAAAATIEGIDAARLRASLARLRAELDPEQRQRLDNAMQGLLVSRMRAQPRDDPAGPLGVFVDALADLQGRPATSLIAAGEAQGGLTLDGARTNANESAAIATLKNISSAQAQCQASGVIDVNGNGAGEYGSFAELAGVAPIRGGDGRERISPPVLSASLGRVTEGVVVRSGYVFRMFLPLSCDGRWVAEANDGGSERLGVDPASAEVLWCAYAWPVSYGESGSRAFFVDASGDVLACDNRARWSGPARGPDVLAAIRPGSCVELAANEIGQSGDHWTVVQ